MHIVNKSSYLYTTSVKTGKDANGKSTLKHFAFPPFDKTHKKVEVTREDYNLLLTHPNFKARVDMRLIKVEGMAAPVSIDETDKVKAKEKTKKDVTIEVK